MVLSMTALSSFIVTYIIDGIEQKLNINLVHGKKEFLKGLSLDLFYLMSI